MIYTTNGFGALDIPVPNSGGPDIKVATKARVPVSKTNTPQNNIKHSAI